MWIVQVHIVDLLGSQKQGIGYATCWEHMRHWLISITVKTADTTYVKAERDNNAMLVNGCAYCLQLSIVKWAIPGTWTFLSPFSL